MIKLAQRQKRCQCQPSAIAISPDRASAMNASFWNYSRTRQPAWDNQVLQRQLRAQGLRAKPILNLPEDRYEKEANRSANEIMRMPDAAFLTPPLKRKSKFIGLKTALDNQAGPCHFNTPPRAEVIIQRSVG